jgi:hypothetical protein
VAIPLQIIVSKGGGSNMEISNRLTYRRLLFAVIASILLLSACSNKLGGLGGGAQVSASSVSIPAIPPQSQITDSGGNMWTVTGGVVYENGKTAGFSESVVLLIYYNNVIYQENVSGGWWEWINGNWSAVSGNPTL